MNWEHETNETRWRCGWFDFGPIQTPSGLDWKRDICYVANTTSAVRLRCRLSKPWEWSAEMKTKTHSHFFAVLPNSYVRSGFVSAVLWQSAQCPWRFANTFFDFSFLKKHFILNGEWLHPSIRSAVNYIRHRMICELRSLEMSIQTQKVIKNRRAFIDLLVLFFCFFFLNLCIFAWHLV